MKSYREQGAPCTRGRIALHSAVMPMSVCIGSRVRRIEHQGAKAWQADLPRMRVAA